MLFPTYGAFPTKKWEKWLDETDLYSLNFECYFFKENRKSLFEAPICGCYLSLGFGNFVCCVDISDKFPVVIWFRFETKIERIMWICEAKVKLTLLTQ